MSKKQKFGAFVLCVLLIALAAGMFQMQDKMVASKASAQEGSVWEFWSNLLDFAFFSGCVGVFGIALILGEAVITLAYEGILLLAKVWFWIRRQFAKVIRCITKRGPKKQITKHDTGDNKVHIYLHDAENRTSEFVFDRKDLKGSYATEQLRNAAESLYMDFAAMRRRTYKIVLDDVDIEMFLCSRDTLTKRVDIFMR